MSRWKELIRGAAAVLAAVVIAGAGMGVPAKAADQSTEDIEWKTVDKKVPTFEYQKSNVIKMYIKNNHGSKKIKNIIVEPYIEDEDIGKWPFRKDNQDDEQKIEELEAGKTYDKIAFEFTERDDIETANHKIYFRCSYTYEDGTKDIIDKGFWVKTTAKPEEPKEDKPLEIHITDKTPKENEDTKKEDDKKEDDTKEDDKKEDEEIPSDDDGGFSNGDASYSGGGGDEGEGDSSVPRVIVTGFDTKPKEVKAGTDFTLTVHLKNTSKKTKVKNMLFDLNAPEEGSDEQTTAPAFLPSSGSSTVYLDGISSNGTADISMKLNAKSDLLQKPYSVELSMKYEDSSGGAIDASSSLSIPVKQDARFEFSDFEINPESVAVGDEANVMCSLYNLGRTKLYNVKAIFEGNSIEKEELFVGNIESGATASIDAMLKGAQATEGPEPITMTMSYEDEEGEVTTEQKELMLEVMESMEGDMETGLMEEEEQSGGFPIIPVVIAIGAIGMASAAVILIKERKKKMRKIEEEDFLDELDGSSEDEQW